MDLLLNLKLPPLRMYIHHQILSLQADVFIISILCFFTCLPCQIRNLHCSMISTFEIFIGSLFDKQILLSLQCFDNRKRVCFASFFQMYSYANFRSSIEKTHFLVLFAKKTVLETDLIVLRRWIAWVKPFICYFRPSNLIKILWNYLNKKNY